MKSGHIFLRVFSLLTLIWITGCAAPDPVKGWKAHSANFDPPNRTNYHNYPNSWYYRPDQIYQIDQSIIEDHRNFVEELKEKYPHVWVVEIYYYEDGTGQHAVKLRIETEMRDYKEFYLMYDKANVRTKVIKGRIWHQFHI